MNEVCLLRHACLFDEPADQGFHGFVLTGAEEAFEDDAMGQHEWCSAFHIVGNNELAPLDEGKGLSRSVQA